MKKIIPIIANQSLTRLGVIDDYKSIIWSTRYYEHGDFEITTGVNPHYYEFLSIGNYVIRSDDDNVGIIEKVEVIITEYNEEVLIASGRFLTQILSRRIIANQTQVNTNVASAIYKLINDAIISPTIAERQINNFILGDFTSTQALQAQFTGRNLYDVIAELSIQYKLGFKITLNDSNQFVFQLYEGVDRSYDQVENPYVVFSDVYDNLLNAQFQRDARNLITNVLVAGEGEGDARKTIWVSNGNPTGLARYEYWDDSRNISSNDGEIPQAEYMNQLAEAGKENLTTYETTFAGEADFGNISYKSEVNLGDICTIENKKLGKYFNARIIEVIESINESGKYTIIPTFGT